MSEDVLQHMLIDIFGLDEILNKESPDWDVVTTPQWIRMRDHVELTTGGQWTADIDKEICEVWDEIRRELLGDDN